MRTVGNAVIIDIVIGSFDFQFVFQRNICIFKGSFLKQIFIDFNGVKSSIPQKGFGVDKRMVFKKVLQHRNKGFGIRKAFVIIWRVGFLSSYDIRMGIQKIFVIKADIPDNAKPVCNDAEFKGTTEMSIDIHLLDGRIGSGVGRHGFVGSSLLMLSNPCISLLVTDSECYLVPTCDC